MELFNRNEIEILKQAEKYFHTVIDLNYKSASPIALNKLIGEMYDKKMGTKTKYNWSCNVCMFNLYKSVGTLYYKSKEYYENKAIQAQEAKAVKQSTTTTKKTAQKRKKATKTTK